MGELAEKDETLTSLKRQLTETQEHLEVGCCGYLALLLACDVGAAVLVALGCSVDEAGL